MAPAHSHKTPGRVTIRVGGRCNNNCVFCAANSHWVVRTAREICADIAAAVRDGAESLHVSGGELTAHPELRVLLRFLKQTGRPWSLASNGRLFAADGVAAAFAGAGLARATVSLHGPDAVHDAVSGVDAHGQATAGIRRLLAAGIGVELSTVLTRPLVESCDAAAFADEVTALGVARATLRAVEPEPALAARDAELVPDLASLATWAADFRAAFAGTVLMRGIPQDIVPQVGHLRFCPGGTLRDFDVAQCPYKARTRSPSRGLDGLILHDETGYRLWHLATPAPEPALLAARLVHGQVWLARRDELPAPLTLSGHCASCHRLHECPAVFERGAVDTALPQPASEGDTTAFLTREVWLVEDGADIPDRPAPLEPVAVLRALRAREMVPVSYEIPAGDARRPFRARMVRREEAGDPLVATRHEGVSLQVTESCMCRCVMCNIVGYFKTPMMPLPRVLRTLEEAGLLGIRLADLFGGEVTLRKDLFPLIRFVRGLGMEAMFITTGYYLTPGFVRRLEAAGVNRVVVSIDGSRAEIHDAVRQLPGIWDRAVRALRALAAQPGIEAFASTVILSENLWDLPDLVRLSARLGIRKHEFFLPISGPVSSTTPRWPSRDEMEVLLDEVLPEVEEVAKQHGVEVDFRPEIRRWTLPRAEAVEMVSQGLYNLHARVPESRCQAPGFNLFVTVNGNVYPCDMPSVIHRDEALGSLHETTLLGIVTSDAMRAFAARAGHYEACRMCVGRYEAVREGPP